MATSLASLLPFLKANMPQDMSAPDDSAPVDQMGQSAPPPPQSAPSPAIPYFLKAVAGRGDAPDPQPPTPDLSASLTPQQKQMAQADSAAQHPTDPEGGIIQSMAPQGAEATPKLAGETKGHALMRILLASASGGAAGAGERTFGGGFQRAQELPLDIAARRQSLIRGGLENQQLSNMLPFARAMQVANLQKTAAETNKNTAEAGKADAEAKAVPTKQALEQAQAAAAAWKEEPATGLLVNTTTGQRLTPNGQGMIPMPKDLAEQSGIPEMANKPVAPKFVKDVRDAVMGGNSYQDFGGHKWMVDKDGNKLRDMGPSNALVMANFNMGGGGYGVPGNSGGAGGGSGDQGAKTMNDVPPLLRGAVKQILDYRGPMPPQGRNNPRNNAIRDWVNAIDPTYDETTFPQRNKILTEYVKDAGDGQLGAINTALGHLGELNDAAKALSQNNIPLLHSIASKLGAAIGGDAATTYMAILHKVGPELTSAYVKGGGGEGERGANEADYSIDKGQAQILSNIGEAARLLRSKLSSKEYNWNNTFRPSRDADKFENRFITPQAKQTLNDLSAQAPSSKTQQSAPQQQSASAQNGLSAGQKVTLKNGKTVTIKAVHPDGSFDVE